MTRHFLYGLIYLFLIAMCAYTTFPFLWMLLSSLKPLNEIFGQGLLPTNPSLENFRRLFAETPALQALMRSFLIAISATVSSVFFCALGGYGFAKFSFPGKGFLFTLMLATMAIPFAVTLVPLFMMMRNVFGWIDTPYPLIVPGIANAFGIFFMRQYMQSVSDEMLDAARIDGANEIQIFLRLVLPTVTPGLASLGIIFFMGSWNNFLFPTVVLRDPSSATLPVLIASLTGDAGRTPYDLIMAASVVSTVPMVLVFLFLQRFFYAGITAGSVKG
jgi:ABC-type glycerol-3-phosphate transport system permease component